MEAPPATQQVFYLLATDVHVRFENHKQVAGAAAGLSTRARRAVALATSQLHQWELDILKVYMKARDGRV